MRRRFPYTSRSPQPVVKPRHAWQQAMWIAVFSGATAATWMALAAGLPYG